MYISNSDIVASAMRRYSTSIRFYHYVGKHIVTLPAERHFRLEIIVIQGFYSVDIWSETDFKRKFQTIEYTFN